MTIRRFFAAACMSLAMVSCAGDPVVKSPPRAKPQARALQKPAQRSAELDASEVVFAIRGNETSLRRCFFANPSARGVARVTWKVTEDGEAADVRLEQSTLGTERVEQCLLEQVSALRFNRREKPARANWTFVFRLVDPPDADAEREKRPKRKQLSAQGVVVERSSRGWLEPETIDQVVESSYPLFARCYRDGVERNSALDGVISLRFVVDHAGAVSTVLDAGSDLSDRQVVDCVAEAFFTLRFPEPARGSVNVLYRIRFGES